MSSIRTRLFAILMAATGAVWLSALVWLQYATQRDVERVLDRRLEEAAHMVSSLIADGGIGADAAARAVAGAPSAPTPTPPRSATEAPALPHGAHRYARQLSCQVWGLDGQLIGESGGAPGGRLAEDGEGFADTTVSGEVWRVFTLVDRVHGIRVMVGDAQSVRADLVRGVLLGLAVPGLLALPALAGLIWLALARGLAPLERMARALSARGAQDLSPLDTAGSTPRELAPMGRALNDLLARLADARRRERDFTAFAAHELKTPLAGLRTQAQVASIAPDAETRNHALSRLVAGVDRSDRLVRQLLAMAATEAEAESGAGAAPRPGAAVLSDCVQDLTMLAAGRGVKLAVHDDGGSWISRQPAFLALALRNLIENAIHASPPGATVDITARRQDDRIRLRIEDRGPGIAAGDRDRVTERFYRGSGRPVSGSGLGLAIVVAAAGRMQGTLTLAPRPAGGERAELSLPAA